MRPVCDDVSAFYQPPPPPPPPPPPEEPPPPLPEDEPGAVEDEDTALVSELLKELVKPEMFCECQLEP